MIVIKLIHFFFKLGFVEYFGRPQNRTNTTKPETKDNNENDEKKEDENNAA